MIPIHNVYYMLTYAFKVLNQNGYKKIATEKFENTSELMASILIKGISMQIKRGLRNEYMLEIDDLSTLKGKVDIGQSIKTQSLLRKRIICNYDDFSVNNKMNKIIKSTLMLLLKANISLERKKQLRKLLVYFSDVNLIDLSRIDWKFNYNRNNRTYRMLISICYLVTKGLIQNKSDGKIKLMDFLDEQRMSKLYEKFILEYYKKHFPILSPKASQIPWALDNGLGDMLPTMQTDVHLQKENTVLIIDAKYYSKTTQINYGKHTIHSHNLYQIFTYVKNREYNFGDIKNSVSGMLLYAKTEDDNLPDNNYQMHGNQISVKTLDLGQSFEQISYQLDEIVISHFNEIKKFE